MAQLRDNKEFVEFAKRATAGLDKSNVMIGIWDQSNKPARLEFAIQIGHCLLEEKPLVLICPLGAKVPDKLKEAATVVEYFSRDNEETIHAAVKRALEKLSIETTH